MKNDYFVNIFEKYHSDVYRLAYSYTHNKEDADDISQKVFIKYYKNIEKINKIELDVKKWLIITTINECKDLFRNIWHKRVGPIDEKNIIKDYPKKNTDFQNLLEKLPSNYRIIIHLYYYYGYTTKEIAKIMKIKETTVRQRLFRARNILKLQKEKIYE